MARCDGYRVLALAWSALAVLYSLLIAALILGDAHFPLNLGSVRTVGRAGLWVTLAPGLVGLCALVLVLRHTRAGAWLLALDSLFWAGLLLFALPVVWNARSSFCTATLCVSTPWLGRLLVLALAAPFLLVAAWARREARRLRVHRA